MTPPPLAVTFAKYRRKGALLDANLLLLYGVGRIVPERLRSFAHTKQFTHDDFVLLARVVVQFQRLVTTPNILTEVSNLATKFDPDTRAVFLRGLIPDIAQWDEHYVPSRQVCDPVRFPRFGLTDVGIIERAHTPFLVITTDRRLSNFLSSQKKDVINFTDLRVMAGTY